MTTNACRHTRGFSLIEMLIYVALLSGFSILVASVLLAVGRSYHALAAESRLNGDAMSVIDRLGHEIRLASSVDGASTLDASPGDLKLNTTDADGNDATAELYLSGSTLHLKENGVDTGALTSAGTQVTSLVFREVGSGTALGVRTEFTLLSTSGTASSTQNFYTFFLMRSAH